MTRPGDLSHSLVTEIVVLDARRREPSPIASASGLGAVRTFETETELLRAAPDAELVVVLLDAPGSFRSIRNLRQGRHQLRIVGASAHPDARLHASAIAAGVDRFVLFSETAEALAASWNVTKQRRLTARGSRARARRPRLCLRPNDPRRP